MRTVPKSVNARAVNAGPAPVVASKPMQRASLAVAIAGVLAAFTLTDPAVAQSGSSDQLVPAEKTAAAVANRRWRVPKFSWGDPNLEGTFTSRDMSGIPMTRPKQFGNRAEMTADEYRARVEAGNGGLAALAAGQDNTDRLQLSALDSSEVGTRVFGYTSYIIDPKDGQMPEMTPEGKARAERARVGQSNGPYYTTADFSYYDRCITRGITGSILPSLYGDAMRIIQSPNSVSITYEMLHDTRIIPLDGTPPADDGIRQYMGTSVGHFEGDTLVVETTGLTDKLQVGRMPHSEDLKLTERFTRIDPDMIDYEVTVDDPRTWVRPWTFRMTLTTQPNYEILEYSCHEGNIFVEHALRAEHRYQARVTEAKANGEPIPERTTPGSGFLEIYAPPTADEAVDINAIE